MPRAILIVDDEATLVSVLAETLADEGFAVRTAPHGAAALAEHTRDPVDVILSDIMMPVVDGPALVNALRARGDLTPVILMSAAGHWHTLPPDVPLVSKPFDLDALIAQVNRSLNG